MSTPTHLALGYLVARQAILAHIMPPELSHSIISVSMLASVIPDVDTLAFWKITRHRRNSLLHYPLFWFFLTGIFALYFIISDHRLLFAYTLIVGINVLIHFLLDTFSVNDGIKWFYPFSKREYNFIRVSRTDNIMVIAQRYLHHPLTFLEMIVWGITLFIRFKTGFH